jgi:hypothetical protein
VKVSSFLFLLFFLLRQKLNETTTNKFNPGISLSNRTNIKICSAKNTK